MVILLVGALLVVGGVMWLQRSRAYMRHGQNGMLLLQKGKTVEAIAELQNTVRLRPNFAAGHAALARAYITEHDYENAAAEMQRVIALNPRSEDAYYRLGLIYLQQNLASTAQDVFAQLLKINPNSTDGHAGLADALSNHIAMSRRLKNTNESRRSILPIRVCTITWASLRHSSSYMTMPLRHCQNSAKSVTTPTTRVCSPPSMTQRG